MLKYKFSTHYKLLLKYKFSMNYKLNIIINEIPHSYRQMAGLLIWLNCQPIDQLFSNPKQVYRIYENVCNSCIRVALKAIWNFYLNYALDIYDLDRLWLKWNVIANANTKNICFVAKNSLKDNQGRDDRSVHWEFGGDN